MGDRYIPSAKHKVVFAPSVANIAAPTQAEITAGTALNTPGTTVTAGLVEMAGWETASSDVEVPDVATRHTGKIPGRTSTGDASATFYDDDSGTSTQRTAQAEGTAGYMIIMRYGQTTGKRASVYPCKVNTVNDTQTNSANESSRFIVTYSLTSAPNKDAIIAA